MNAWRTYIWVFSAILIFSAFGRVLLFVKRRDLVSRLDLVEAFVGIAVIPALLGFAYGRACGPHMLWMFLSLVLCVLSIYQFFTPKMRKLYQKGPVFSVGIIGFQAALGGPALWALLNYSFFWPELWA